MMRAKEKRHGKSEDRYFIGEPDVGLVVLEDVTTSGDSLRKAVKSIFEYTSPRSFGILAAVSLLDRSEGEAEEVMGAMDVPFHSMLTARDLLPTAYSRLVPGDGIGKAIDKEYKENGLEPIGLESVL
jgi:orotate phosphoribosyltransferase